MRSLFVNVPTKVTKMLMMVIRNGNNARPKSKLSATYKSLIGPNEIPSNAFSDDKE